MLCRSFIHVALVLAITSTAVPAFALDSHVAAPGEPAITETGTPDAIVLPHAGTTPARSKYVHSTPTSTPVGGSDGDDSGVVHSSVRNSKWHSYLPGMFR